MSFTNNFGSIDISSNDIGTLTENTEFTYTITCTENVQTLIFTVKNMVYDTTGKNFHFKNFPIFLTKISKFGSNMQKKGQNMQIQTHICIKMQIRPKYAEKPYLQDLPVSNDKNRCTHLMFDVGQMNVHIHRDWTY